MSEKPPDLRDFIKDKSDGEYTYVRPHLRRVSGGGGGGDGLLEVLLLVVFLLIFIFYFAIIPFVKGFLSLYKVWIYWIYLDILIVISVLVVRWAYRDYRNKSRRLLPWYLMAVVLLGLIFLFGFFFLTWAWQATAGDSYSYGCLGTILVILGSVKLYQRRKRKRQIASEINQR